MADRDSADRDDGDYDDRPRRRRRRDDAYDDDDRPRKKGGMSRTTLPLASGWRAEAIRPHLDAVLDGRSAVRVSDPASQTPLSLLRLPTKNPSGDGV